MIVFDRIKYLANKKGMSLSEVAIELGFSPGLFYQWKRAKPKAENLGAVANYFGVSIDYLLGREEESALTKKHGIFLFDGETITDE